MDQLHMDYTESELETSFYGFEIFTAAKMSTTFASISIYRKYMLVPLFSMDLTYTNYLSIEDFPSQEFVARRKPEVD